MEEQELQLMVFTIGETRYGIDSHQIACLENYNPDQNQQMLKFHELVGAQSASYGAPKILRVKSHRPYPAVLITEPEDMIGVLIKAIRPLPPLIINAANCKGIWAVLPHKQGLILLFDFYKNSKLKDWVG